MIVETILHSIFLFKYQLPVADLFLPLQNSDELMPFGASQAMKLGLKDMYTPSTWVYVLASLGWITLYYFIGRKRLAKSDW